MQPVVVVPADPFNDGEIELGTGLPDAVADQLGLEAVHETQIASGTTPPAARCDPERMSINTAPLRIASRAACGSTRSRLACAHANSSSIVCATASRHASHSCRRSFACEVQHRVTLREDQQGASAVLWTARHGSVRASR